MKKGSRNILIFENDDFSKIDQSLIKNYNFFFINPSAYFNNKNNIKKNFYFYGLDFNEYIYKNFKEFKNFYFISKSIIIKKKLDAYINETISNLIIPIISTYLFATYKLKENNFFFISEGQIHEVSDQNFDSYLKKFLGQHKIFYSHLFLFLQMN